MGFFEGGDGHLTGDGFYPATMDSVRTTNMCERGASKKALPIGSAFFKGRGPENAN